MQLTNRRLSTYRWRADFAYLYTTVYLCLADRPHTHTHNPRTALSHYIVHQLITPLPTPRSLAENQQEDFPPQPTLNPTFTTLHPGQLHTPEFCRQSPTGLSAPPSRPRFPKGPQGHARKLGTIFFGEIFYQVLPYPSTKNEKQDKKTVERRSVRGWTGVSEARSSWSELLQQLSPPPNIQPRKETASFLLHQPVPMLILGPPQAAGPGP